MLILNSLFKKGLNISMNLNGKPMNSNGSAILFVGSGGVMDSVASTPKIHPENINNFNLFYK